MDLEVCKVWELRVNNLWPVMRMYPNLKTLMLEHVRNQVRQGGGEEGGRKLGGRRRMWTPNLLVGGHDS